MNRATVFIARNLAQLPHVCSLFSFIKFHKKYSNTIAFILFQTLKMTMGNTFKK